MDPVSASVFSQGRKILHPLTPAINLCRLEQEALAATAIFQPRKALHTRPEFIVLGALAALTVGHAVGHQGAMAHAVAALQAGWSSVAANPRAVLATLLASTALTAPLMAPVNPNEPSGGPPAAPTVHDFDDRTVHLIDGLLGKKSRTQHVDASRKALRLSYRSHQ